MRFRGSRLKATKTHSAYLNLIDRHQPIPTMCKMDWNSTRVAVARISRFQSFNSGRSRKKSDLTVSWIPAFAGMTIRELISIS